MAAAGGLGHSEARAIACKKIPSRHTCLLLMGACILTQFCKTCVLRLDILDKEHSIYIVTSHLFKDGHDSTANKQVNLPLDQGLN